VPGSADEAATVGEGISPGVSLPLRRLGNALPGNRQPGDTASGRAHIQELAVLATTALVGRAAAATGLVSAAIGILSLLFFRWENAGWLIPIGRFSGYILAGMTGVRLPGPGRPDHLW
jgi:hypothetical protein